MEVLLSIVLWYLLVAVDSATGKSPSCTFTPKTESLENRDMVLKFFFGKNIAMPTNNFYAFLRLNHSNTADILSCQDNAKCKVNNPSYRVDGITNTTMTVIILNMTTEKLGVYVLTMNVNGSWERVIICNTTEIVKGNEEENTPVEAILIPVLIVVVIIIVIVIIAYRKWRKRRRSANREDSGSGEQDGQADASKILLQTRSDWFFGQLDQATANDLLMSADNQDGSYLIWVSKNSPGMHRLSVRYGAHTSHHVIHNDEDGFWIEHDKKFGQLQDLINGYIEDAGCLPHPLFTPCKRPEQN